jgi:hypothetical protein
MRTTKILDEIDGFTLTELKREIKEEEGKASKIEEQLNNIRNVKHATGEMADHDWYRSATSALRLTRFRIVLMNRRHKQFTENNDGLLPRTFMMVAKRLLKEDTYDMLMNFAKEESKI